MRFLINLRNRIEGFVKKHIRVSSYIIKLVMVFAALFILSSNVGFNATLSSLWFVIILSFVCAFIPLRFLLFIILGYTVIQMYTLSAGVAGITAIILLLMYMIYFRFSGNYAFIIVLLPVMFILNIPAVVPLLIAVIAPLDSLISIVFGTIIYFMIHYVNINTTVFNDMANTELQKASLLLEGTFTNNVFLYTLIIMIIVFVVVFLVKRVNSNRSNDIAVCIGTGVNIILLIAANLIFNTISADAIIESVVFSVIAGIIAEVIHNAVLPLDYTRTNMLQFEDSEYYYYVRAIPKAAIEKQTVRVKRINASKRKPEKRADH